MGIDVTRPYLVGGANLNSGFNYPKNNVRFGENLASDSFENTSPNRFTNEIALTRAINSNPKIKNILNEMNAPAKLNLIELDVLLKGHATDVQNISEGIVENLPFALKNKVNLSAIKEAAYLHDVGKVLIPAEILNKNGKLDSVETRVMHRHSELSYELLKNTNIDKTTLNLVRNHHQNAKKTGYPWVGQDFSADLNLQVLSMADKYSALTEKRTYKDPLSSKQALTIIYKDVHEGKLHPFVFKALVDYAANSEHALPII